MNFSPPDFTTSHVNRVVIIKIDRAELRTASVTKIPVEKS